MSEAQTGTKIIRKQPFNLEHALQLGLHTRKLAEANPRSGFMAGTLALISDELVEAASYARRIPRRLHDRAIRLREAAEFELDEDARKLLIAQAEEVDLAARELERP